LDKIYNKKRGDVQIAAGYVLLERGITPEIQGKSSESVKKWYNPVTWFK
jgi:hypothetical protein